MSNLNDDQHLNELHWRRSAGICEGIQRYFSHIDEQFMDTLKTTMGPKHTIPNISNAINKGMANYLAN